MPRLTTTRGRMSATASRDEQRLVGSFRAVLIGLAAFTCVGAVLEPASLCHWRRIRPVHPLVRLALVVVGIVVLPVRRSPPTALIARPDRVVHADGIPARRRTAAGP